MPDAEFLIEQWMTHHILLARLIRRNHCLTPRRSEFYRATLTKEEVILSDLPTIDECDRQPVRQQRTKFLHQIKRQPGTIRTFCVQIPDKRIKPRSCERSNAIVPDQCVQVRQQTVDRIARWTARPGGEGKVL